MPHDTELLLTDDEITERADIVWSTDDQACQDCGRTALCGSAADPEWFIDREAGRAVVRCPDCW